MASISIQRMLTAQHSQKFLDSFFKIPKGLLGEKKGCQSFWLAVILMDFFLLSSALIEDVATSLVITV